jgi:hypothetical protein
LLAALARVDASGNQKLLGAGGSAGPIGESLAQGFAALRERAVNHGKGCKSQSFVAESN